VHVLVFNKRGEVLLQQRSALKDAHPGVWDSSVAGHLDAGESYEAAALRELDEEMGIRGAEPAEVARLAACEETGNEFVRLYHARHDGPIRFPCGEIRAALWFQPDELDAWLAARPDDFASGFRVCWAAWRAERMG
jgi:16S rRNA (adenine1518-N6/adenine1519-N6)-dimethyltransferase